MADIQPIYIEPIGFVRSIYGQKFGVPRQPGLIDDVTAELILVSNDFNKKALTGLGGFSHIWLTFLFHLIKEEDVRSMVRPPRAGGKKVGVFACRSPHRPNRIGLSLLKMDEIKIVGGEIRIKVIGADLVDGTPILDIKPYVVYSDATKESQQGWIHDLKDRRLRVSYSEEALLFLQGKDLLRRLISKTLSLDPRPALQRDQVREFILDIDGHQVKFSVASNNVVVESIYRGHFKGE